MARSHINSKRWIVLIAIGAVAVAIVSLTDSEPDDEAQTRVPVIQEVPARDADQPKTGIEAIPSSTSELKSERDEFERILLTYKADQAYSTIGDRMLAFAENVELAACLDALGRGREPAVMSMPFLDLVALCETQLGLPAVPASKRWRSR